MASSDMVEAERIGAVTVVSRYRRESTRQRRGRFDCGRALAGRDRFRPRRSCGGDPDASRIPRAAAVSTILRVHQASGVLDAAPHRIDLALAGHTHGGQIVFPGDYAPATPSGTLSRSYPAGRFELPGGGTLLVSRGVGTSTIPFRWNAPADLLVVTLRGANDLIS